MICTPTTFGAVRNAHRVSLPGRPASGPVRFGRRLVVATYDGAVVEVDPEKSEVTKVYEAPGDLGSPPTFLPAAPAPGTDWFASHRIALSIRTGEVLLLSHRAGVEEEEGETEATEETEEDEKRKPRPKRPSSAEDSVSWK